MTRRTVFPPASVSKLLTATLVMRQVERGHLELDRAANDYLEPADWIRDGAGRPVAATVRQLLTWIVPTLRPDLVVVLVDRNAEQGRKQRIQRYVANIVVPKVIGVATKEFEAWLISDHPTIGSVLGNSPPLPTLPERMNSGEAKNVLREWGALFAPQLAPKDIRLAVARNCDLNELSRRSRSFRSFVHNLRHCAV